MEIHLLVVGCSRSSRQAERVEFSYRLVDTGWAHARLADGDTCVELPASYRSDALSELLTALSAIQDGADTAACTWREEPGEYRWDFTHDTNRLKLEVRCYHRAPTEDGQVIFACEARTADMEHTFTAAIRQVLDQWGEAGYLAEWLEHPFPTDLLAHVEARIPNP